MAGPWRPEESEEDRAARRQAYQRLVEAARRAGHSTERLARMLREVAHNEAETRRLLREVYGVPEALLDDVLRVRLEDLERPDRSEP